MKILFLSDALSYHTQRWVNYYVGKGHLCFLATLDRGLKTEATEYLILSSPFPNFLRYPLALSQVRNLAKQIQPDLINAHYIPSYGLLGAKLKFHPLVISTWGSDVLISPGKSWLHRKRAEYVLKKADLVTTDALFTAEVIHQLGVEEDKIIQSPMGVDCSILNPLIKEKKPYWTIMSNRKLEPLYDVKTFIRAIPVVLSQTEKEVRFIVLGNGSQKERLISLARQLNIENKVEFRGVVSREMLWRIYRESDIYVSTSKSDSTSVSLLEAMSFGSIPVVSDIPGNREWIEDGNNGFLFPTSDYKTLAERIIHLIDGLADDAAIREKNHSIIQKRAVWENNMQVIEESFLKLVNRKKS
ncbi:MAG TPA: glycosyltransferase family 4 protein [candidate division Zixibacteria bacterium]